MRATGCWPQVNSVVGAPDECEAADRNGDGKVDARYFYDTREKLVYEQRDMDFDGRAEFVADDSRFPKLPAKSSLVRARDVGN